MKYCLREAVAEKPSDFNAFSDTVSSLLLSRGVATIKDAEAFLSPNYDAHTHDPFLMKDMDRVVERVYEAVKKGEKIVAYSDYDMDGIPGAVILHDALKKVGCTNFENYIPHRHDEGFGLHKDAIDGFKEKGASLVITIDCGITNVAEVAHANALGIDVIITDHHMPHEVLPEAFAILNPKVTGCAYPEKMLCGSGVIFKFVQALYKKYGAEFNIKEGWEKWSLDLVGMATLSDMVPLTGENRVFARYGLDVLKKTRRVGLSRLLYKLKVNREHLCEDDIGFTIAPRINAASRMGEPLAAFNLLSTDDETLAGAYADALEEVNNERKGTVASLVKEIRKKLAERDLSEKKVIVIGNPSWRPSLLGLVANPLADEFGKPAFLWGRDGDDKIKGSVRSGGKSNIVAIMEGAKDHFTHFGGHVMAGGFEVKNDMIFTLEEALNASAEKLGTVIEEKVGFVDAHISLEDVSWTLYKDIEKLAPFGTGNPKPLFLIKGATVEDVKAFGKEKNHTEIAFRDQGGRKISAIQFFMPKSSLPKHVEAKSAIDIVAHLEKSTFKNYPELRLRIVEIL